MHTKFGPGEPPLGPWRIVPVQDVIRVIYDAQQRPPDRPWILAVDGRGAGGKSTLANVLHQAVPASTVVHTDDVAWHHSFFGWSDLLIENILKPVRNGEAVNYQPPGWIATGRPGAIEIAADLDLVVVEGVGASRTEVTPWIDRSIWVQSDFDEAERRGIARDGGTEDVIRFWHEWMAEEIVFLQQHRPWERAAVIVNGTPQQSFDPSTQVMISTMGGVSKDW